MDAQHFDRLARSLSQHGTRRGLLGHLSALPVLGGLLAFLGDPDDTAAKNRRKKRKKPHKRAKRRRQHRGKPKCRAHARAKTCAGKCGTVKNNCKKTINCGSCDCSPPCGICQTCVGSPGTCVPEAVGTPCGDPGQVCQGDGTCACGTDTCPSCMSCGGAGTCQGCTGCCDGDACVLTCGACQTCDEGQCVSCAGAGLDCCDDACVDLDTDPDHCGSCPNACDADQTCQDGVCGVDCNGTFCPVATAICVEDACQTCHVCAAAGCFTSVQDAINDADPNATLYICAGAYAGADGRATIDRTLTLIGAGDGANPESHTILDGSGVGPVVAIFEGITAALEGLRITGGGGTGVSGLGIRSQGPLTVTGCTITGNVGGTNTAGGGITHSGPSAGDLTLIDTQITANHASNGGGGVVFNAGALDTLTLDHCTVTLNTTDGAGAGLNVAFGQVEIINGTRIDDNTAGTNGGGLRLQSGGEVTFDSTCGVTGNEASDGGGISNSGTVTLNGADVTNNEPNNCAGPIPVAGCIED